MIYRIAVKSYGGSFYYLTSIDDPKIDDDVDMENISYLTNISSLDAHAFSTKEICQDVIDSLPYPYDVKSIIVEFESTESPIMKSSYYRIVKYTSTSRINWASSDKTFTSSIFSKTLSFSSLEEAKDFQQSLLGWDKHISRIVEIRDYGTPNYDFDLKILKTGKIIKFRKNS